MTSQYLVIRTPTFCRVRSTAHCLRTRLMLSQHPNKTFEFQFQKSFFYVKETWSHISCTIIFFFVSPLFFFLTAIKNEGICSEKICVPWGGFWNRFHSEIVSMMMMPPLVWRWRGKCIVYKVTLHWVYDWKHLLIALSYVNFLR